jgi:hypothetical protein
MILPAGVNKGTGLHAALKELQLSAHNVVGVADAENDHAFVQLYECSVAIANTLPSIAERVDLVMAADHGAGVVELAGLLEADDLDSMLPRLSRHHLGLGTVRSGQPVGVQPFGPNIMIAGLSGSGKTTLAAGILVGPSWAGIRRHSVALVVDDASSPAHIQHRGRGRTRAPNAAAKTSSRAVISHSLAVRARGVCTSTMQHRLAPHLEK